ncbi:MAG: arginine repressor [Clostridiales Family XIII bacterium]|jgi:transcriptional regulator of arginine metabolism|nr:arginine repressor [Clostridiales Family XIII bacterium]
MRYPRQTKILDIISTYDVDTQDKLLELLKMNGFNVTQATISRDIKDLQLVKTMTPFGKYKYTAASNLDQSLAERFVKIFRETVQTVSSSGNIIVVKTLSGCANAAAEAIDSLNFEHILGTLAGDNTLLLVVNDPVNVPALIERFNEIRG